MTNIREQFFHTRFGQFRHRKTELNQWMEHHGKMVLLDSLVYLKRQVCKAHHKTCLLSDGGLYVLVLLFSVVDLGSLQTFCQKTKWQMDAIKRAASRGKSWIPRKGETSCGGPNYFCCKITQFWPFSGFHSQTENEHFTVLFNYISYGKWTKPKHLTVYSKANYVIVKAFNALI